MKTSCYNVRSKRDIKKLYNSQRFQKYPNNFIGDTCQVRVNADDYLIKDEFIIKSKYKILPKKIYIFGKKGKNNEIAAEDNIYLNYWLEIFLQTIERGNLCKYDFDKSNSKLELTIGLSYRYRYLAFNSCNWTRSNIIKFLSCLFNDSELEETNFEQQDIFENLLVA